MRVGDRVILVKPIDMGYQVYPIGHEFKIVVDDNIRGFDLEDDAGNKVCETRFISDRYILLSDHLQKVRDKKIDKILN